jgi:REP-associated tyrosine transposase
MARPLQLAFPAPRTWGGHRPGAGRKPTPGRRPGVPHRPRLPHTSSHPVHVTLRAGPAVHCLRAARVFPAVCAALAVASGPGFRLLQFSVQDDHLHLIVEADDAPAFARGLRGVAIRVARAVNRALGRRAAVWGDRFHARALTTPRAVRHALVYVLMNRHKHHGGEAPLDPCSSAAWFDGWRQPVGRVPGPAPVVPARTWLAAVGWRRHGLLSFEERPCGGSCPATWVG